MIQDRMRHYANDLLAKSEIAIYTFRKDAGCQTKIVNTQSTLPNHSTQRLTRPSRRLQKAFRVLHIHDLAATLAEKGFAVSL